jgi:hypothetical protein
MTGATIVIYGLASPDADPGRSPRTKPPDQFRASYETATTAKVSGWSAGVTLKIT